MMMRRQIKTGLLFGLSGLILLAMQTSASSSPLEILQESGNCPSCNLSSLDLSASKLDLSGSNLHGANLFSTSLAGLNLSGADLSNADLTGASLLGANTSGASFSGAKFCRTLVPDGSFNDSECIEGDWVPADGDGNEAKIRRKSAAGNWTLTTLIEDSGTHQIQMKRSAPGQYSLKWVAYIDGTMKRIPDTCTLKADRMSCMGGLAIAKRTQIVLPSGGLATVAPLETEPVATPLFAPGIDEGEKLTEIYADWKLAHTELAACRSRIASEKKRIAEARRKSDADFFSDTPTGQGTSGIAEDISNLKQMDAAGANPKIQHGILNKKLIGSQRWKELADRLEANLEKEEYLCRKKLKEFEALERKMQDFRASGEESSQDSSSHPGQGPVKSR